MLCFLVANNNICLFQRINYPDGFYRVKELSRFPYYPFRGDVYILVLEGNFCPAEGQINQFVLTLYMRCSLTCACVSYFLFARSCIMQERKERKKSSALRPQCRTGCIHAKDMKCSLTCAGVFYFPGLAYSPVRENKNVTFSMLTCVACIRSLTGLTSVEGRQTVSAILLKTGCVLSAPPPP